MRVLFDNCMPARLARAIDMLVEPDGDRVVPLKDRFRADTQDEEWITAIGQEGDWVVFTYDRAISRRPHERAALEATDLKICFFASGWQRCDVFDQAWRMIKHWSVIRDALAHAHPSTSLLVQLGGSISRQHRS